GNFSLMYLDIPILFRVFPIEVGKARIYEFGGPYFSFLLRARGTPSAGGESRDVSDQFGGKDAGVTVGAGIDIKRFIIDFRASFGIANIGAPNFTDVTYHNRSISIMAGYRLKYEAR